MAVGSLSLVKCAALWWGLLRRRGENGEAHDLAEHIEQFLLNGNPVSQSALQDACALLQLDPEAVKIELRFQDQLNQLNDKEFWAYIRQRCKKKFGLDVQASGSEFDFALVIDSVSEAPIFSSTALNEGALADFCAFIDSQVEPLEGIFYLRANSDVFTGDCSDAAFLHVADKWCNHNGIYVNISCDSNHHLHVDDIFNEFSFEFFWNGSQLVMDYKDPVCTLQKNFNLMASQATVTSKTRLLQDNFSDCSDYPHAFIEGLVDCALICVDVDSPVTHIDCIDCMPMTPNTISDAGRLCEMLHCACEIETCLEELYGSIDDIVDHRCCLTYTGPISATRVRVDLENCRIFYEDFFIPGCSDLSIL